MIFKLFAAFLLNAIIIAANIHNKLSDVSIEDLNLVNELTDDKWDQIQKGQWLVGFFDSETEESKLLEQHWQVFAQNCKSRSINVARILAPQNPGLYVRFLVSVFPKVFYIKNGVAHEIPKVNKEVMIDLIRSNEWSKLKAVNFLNNPFSVQMSLLSHVFIYAVKLYNFENSIVQEYIPIASATDIVFALTFIIVGTFLGLLMTCAFGLLQIFFLDSKNPEDEDEDQLSSDEYGEQYDVPHSSDGDDDQDSSDKDDDKGNETKETDSSDSVRKRK